MMRRTWKRALSALLTIVMVAGLLVVPASAAFDELNVSELDAISANTTAINGIVVVQNGNNKLSLETGSKTFPAKEGTFEAFTGTKYLKWSGKSNNKDTDIIKYTVTGASESSPVTIRVWLDYANGGTLNVANSTGWMNVNWTTDADDTTNKLKVVSTTVTVDGEYHIGFSAAKDCIYKVAIGTEDVGADEIKLTFTVAEGLSVTDLTVADAAKTFKSPINVAKNAKVTFKVTSEDAAVYTVNEVKFGEDTLTAGEDDVYTIADVGGADATVTITANSSRVPAESVTISGDATANMSVGDTVALTAAMTPDSTTDTVSWASRDTGVATVGNDGTVTAKAIGKTTITATASGVTATDSDPKATRDVTVIGADQTGDSYTFESKIMGAVTAYGTATEVKYDNHFSVMFGSGTKVDTSSKNWTGEGIAYESAQRLALGGAGSTTQNALKITTGAAATVNIWWVANKVNGKMILQDSAGTVVAVDGTNQETAAATTNNTELTGQLSIPAAGTYYLVSSSEGGNYLFKVEVTEEEAGGETVNKEALTAAIEAAETAIAAITVDTNAANVPEGTKWILAADKATYQAAIDAAKAVATKDGAEQTEVDGAVTVLAAATTAFEDAQKDGAKLKTMTVTAANVTATYDGTAKTIQVEGAPTGATITYCATSDGTYAATQPEMKYASDTAYTVYYKVTADGYETAAGSATVTINKAAAPTILVTADLSEGIPAEGGSVTFTATGVPEGTLTGQCDQGGGTTFTFAMNGTKLQGVNTVAANETSKAKTHTVSFTWTEHPNYEDATILNETLIQVAQGTVGTTKATGLAVDNEFASKGVTAAADDTDGVTIAIDEATIRTAFAADKAAFQGDGVQHGDDAYIMVTFNAPTGFDKGTWSVQQLVNNVASSQEPWKWDGSTPGNELDVVGTDKIGDWFCILKGVTGDTPTMPDAKTYTMTYKFFDATGNHVATYYYTVERAVTAAPVEYDVTVTGGTADKAKAVEGASVTVTAAAAPTGKVFDKWTATGLTLSETDAAKTTLTFTMPGNAVTLTATYKDEQGENPPAPAGTYILDANDLDVTDNQVELKGTKWGTDGFFEVCSTQAGKPFTPATAASFDGKEWDKTITMGGGFSYNSGDPKAALKFTTTEDSTVKVWWTNTNDTQARNLAIYDSTGTLVKAADASSETSYAVQDVFTYDLGAGTYYLGSNNSSINIYRVEVSKKTAGGETVDKAALNAAITAAEAAIAAITVDTDAANVPEGTKWILAADKATYQAAIDAAKVVAENEEANQDEVEAAVTALATATTAFEAAQKDGTKTDTPVPPTVNKDALKADIAAAEELVKNTAITAQEDNLAGVKYWDSAMKTAYQAAIADAKAVADKADAEQTEVDDAKAALATATAAFKAGKTDGTKELTSDEMKEALAAAITAATAAKEGVVANDATDPADVASGTKYVSNAVMDALKDALKDAEDLKALLDDEDAENDPAPEDLTAALVALKNATTDFQPETGTKSNGGGGSGGGKPAIGSGTKPSGETTKTETLGDGTSVTTTTDSKGVTTVVTKRPDGMETTTVTNEDGDVTITTVNADDVTLAEIKVPATIPANDQKFVDVPEGHWAEASINNMAALNMVKGVDDVNHIFDMNSDVTRGSVATILYRFANGKDGMSQAFSDVAEGQWYTDAVAWASNAGVVTGFENGTFQPDGSITREQLAVMIFRYAKLIGLDVSAKGDLRIFADADAIQGWAVDGMSWCVKSGIINGRGDGTVDPTTAATRAEAAAMLDRFVALLK